MTSKVMNLYIGKTSFLYLRFGWDLWRMPDRLDCLEEIGAAAPQGINEDRRHTSRHGYHAPDWINQSRRGRGNHDPVERECEDYVLQHLSVTVPADLVGIDHGANPLIEDNHIGGFDRDVGSAAESNSDFGLHQGRRVVDAVADHGHTLFLLKLADQRRFLGWQYARVNLFDAVGTGVMLRRPLVIAGDHARADAHRMATANSLRRVAPRCIAECEQTEKLSLPCSNDDRQAPRFQPCDAF